METLIKWHGHSAFEITVDGQNLLLDPWFNDNPKSAMKAKDFTKVDLIAVSHGHSDHFGDTMELMRNTQAKCICSTMISHYLNLRGFPVPEGRNISMAQGGTVDMGNMRVSMVNAQHACALFADEWPQLKQYTFDGGAVGYVIRTNDDKHSIYFAGDTDVMMDMQLIERRYHPDVCILPIGGRFTMDVDSVMIALEMLKPKIMIPMHYNTHGGIPVDEEAFKKSMAEKFPEIKLVMMQPGETFVLEEA